MTVSFVLRLLPHRLLDGEIVGEVECVGDGENVFVKDAEGLRAFLVASASRTLAGDHATQDGGPPSPR